MWNLKITKIMNTENRLVVAGVEGEERESKCIYLELLKSPADAMYSMVSIVNNNVLYILKLLRDWILKDLIIRKKVF